MKRKIIKVAWGKEGVRLFEEKNNSIHFLLT
jgi:hypothetical protein